MKKTVEKKQSTEQPEAEWEKELQKMYFDYFDNDFESHKWKKLKQFISIQIANAQKEGYDEGYKKGLNEF